VKFSGVIDIALEADHPASSPNFICAIAPGSDEVNMLARRSLVQQRGNGAIAGLVLIGIEALTLETLGTVFSSH
jgi:hypothetical protein